MAKVFTHDQQVRFSHCDPAGIVYFPEFFDLSHAALEDWFTHGLGHAHAEMITERRVGTPTVHVQCDFYKPFRIGDTLHFEVRVLKMGRSSLTLHYSGKKNGVEHLAITQTVCFLDLDTGHAIAIPEDLRQGIAEYLDETYAGAQGAARS
jgi:4-hydroxybenzoyl-CoA thioesterase